MVPPHSTIHTCTFFRIEVSETVFSYTCIHTNQIHVHSTLATCKYVIEEEEKGRPDPIHYTQTA